MAGEAVARRVIARSRVVESRALTPSSHGIRIERPTGFEYRPVQYVGLELETAEGGLEYPMSMASSPTRPHIEFGARIESGTPWKQAFRALQPGDEVEIDGPYGHFVLDEERPAVMLAGGIGITPLKGMLEYVADKALDLAVTLVYSNRAADDIAYRDELDALARTHGGIEVVHTLTRERPAEWRGRTGRIDAEMIAPAERGKRDPVFYVCGVPGMVKDVSAMLVERGVPVERIRYEEFWGY